MGIRASVHQDEIRYAPAYHVKFAVLYTEARKCVRSFNIVSPILTLLYHVYSRT